MVLRNEEKMLMNEVLTFDDEAQAASQILETGGAFVRTLGSGGMERRRLLPVISRRGRARANAGAPKAQKIGACGA